MEINKLMFREYDIRGIYNEDINEEVSYLIGRAFGSNLKRMGKTERSIFGFLVFSHLREEISFFLLFLHP